MTLHEARTTVRNAGLLLAQRGFHILAGLAFAVVVPRLMGPTVFGQYSLIFSISMWFSLLSGMGALSVMSRYVPQFIVRSDMAGLRKLASNLLVARLANGVAAGATYFVLTVLWLRELDWAALAFIAGSVWVRTGANLFFTLFLGLNQAARWGMGELLRRWLILVFVVVGFAAGGLRGACLGVLLANIGILALGVAWGHPYIEAAELRIDTQFLRPFIRFSAQFASGNLVLALTQRSGEALVRLVSADYSQVGYYGAAYAAYLMIAQAIWQFCAGFMPLLGTMRERGDTEALREWIDRLLKWLSIGAIVPAAAIVLLAPPVVPMILGSQYREVADALMPFAVALPMYALGAVGRVLTIACERGRVAMASALVELVVFWAFGLLLVREAGSFGAAVSAATASTAYAAYVTSRMRRDVRYSVSTWLRLLALGLLVVPLAWVSRTLPLAVAAFGVYLVVFGALLFLLRLVTYEEIRAVQRRLRGVGRSESEPS